MQHKFDNLFLVLPYTSEQFNVWDLNLSNYLFNHKHDLQNKFINISHIKNILHSVLVTFFFYYNILWSFNVITVLSDEVNMIITIFSIGFGPGTLVL